MTGTASMSNLSMIGASVPAGNWDKMVFTLSRTSCAAMSRLRSRKNWIVMRETPSMVVLLSSSIPWTVLMISSNGRVTLVSISSGDAPRRVVVTVTMGSSTFGNWSMPICRNENQPRTTRNRLIIVAKTGREMHRSAMPRPRVGGAGAPEAGGGGGDGGWDLMRQRV